MKSTYVEYVIILTIYGDIFVGYVTIHRVCGYIHFYILVV
jgi:hypothetical protein